MSHAFKMKDGAIIKLWEGIANGNEATNGWMLTEWQNYESIFNYFVDTCAGASGKIVYLDNGNYFKVHDDSTPSNHAFGNFTVRMYYADGTLFKTDFCQYRQTNNYYRISNFVNWAGKGVGYLRSNQTQTPFEINTEYNSASTFIIETSGEYTNFLGVYDTESSKDPYSPGGESGIGGGTGNFDGTGDAVDIPGLPTLSAVDTGFITLFNPSITQLKSLADYLWSGAFDLNTFKKIFANPMDCILGLSIVPVSVPNGESKEVSVGNIPTGISMTVASSQYVIVDCGTLNVNEFWGAYLDYDPYTKAEIYLPYIGTHPISVDDIMGKSVHVVYHIDILSGACTAFVKCGGSVLYEFIGQCSSSIPVTGNDWTNVINGVLSVSAAIGTMVATGGATAPMAASAIASTAVNSMKSNVEKSGSMSGTGGMLAVQTPYLILTRPRQAMPARQNEFTGYPSFITSTLSSLSGYTVVEEIHLEHISGTEQEISEIENLLKTGVIL